ncbi:Integron-associated effector binding protein [Evansella caseinilytica]|uniref:Integron-associated effector binding protein n=1 Tax=Evansella caseinilytica TaxID=1503961 RepID=A0A1H3GNL1_9BACI|nr:HTH domain-containing protein [Evansella caseinilytica]SDY03919.1 Integron-associated effector binding protein [Evansella caseinilytica]
MSKAAKLIALIQVIQVKKTFSVQELADEFHVSYRTMLRYLHELSGLGIPLYAETGKHGGYRILEHSAGQQQPAIRAREDSGVKAVIKPAFRVIGLEYAAPVTSFSAAEVLITKTRDRFESRLHELPECRQPFVRYGIRKYEKGIFTYLYCVEVKRLEHIPAGMKGATVPTRRYAVFIHRGSAARAAVDETYRYGLQQLMRAGVKQDASAGYLEVLPVPGCADFSQEIEILVPFLD